MATLPPQAPTEISFYPTQDYLVPTKTNKGTPWAGVKMPMDSFTALARSQAIAEKQGLVDPETAKYYLASALTEGRFQDYGVNQVDLNYGSAPPSRISSQIKQSADYDNQRQHLFDYINAQPRQQQDALRNSYVPTLSALTSEGEKYKKPGYEDKVWGPGSSYGKLRAMADKLGLDDPNSEEIEKGAKYGRYTPSLNSNGDDRITPEMYHRNAAVKTLGIANKVYESGKTGLDAWEAYNGSGPDARRYKKRISAAYDNLSHEKNKDMWNAYQNLVKQYKLELEHGKN